MGFKMAVSQAAPDGERAGIIHRRPELEFARRWPLRLGEEKVAGWRRTGWLPLYHYGDKMERRVGYQLLEDATQYEDYPEISQPALIFHGRNDDVVPVEYYQEFAARHPQVRLRGMEA